MKKYGVLFVVMAVALAASFAIPSIVRKTAVQVHLVYPIVHKLSEDVYVSGSIEELSKKEVYVDIPLVVDQVMVSIGDTVQANEILATVDIEATQAAIFNLVESADVIPKEYITAAGNIGINNNLVESYIPTQILSPASGIVTGMELQPGTVVFPKSVVCTISRIGELRVKMTIPEENADKVKPNDIVVFKATATGDAKYVGQLERVFPTATQTLFGTSTKTVVGMYVSLKEKYPRLKPGYNVRGVVKKNIGQTAMILPYSAVMQDEANQEYVYVYEKSRAVRKNIIIAKEFSWGVAVKKGILTYDLVVKNAADVTKENSLICQAE